LDAFLKAEYLYITDAIGSPI